MHILVVRLSSLGDVVLASAVLSYLHQAYPRSRVWFVTAQSYAELFEADHRINEVFPFDRVNSAACIQELAHEKYDWVIDLQANRLSSRLIVATAGKRLRVTRYAKLYVKRMLLLVCRISRYLWSDHVVARYLRAAGWEGTWPSDIVPSIAVGPQAQFSANAWLKDHIDTSRPLAALMPFAAWKNKQWPLERYAQVGEELIRRGWSIVVLGGSENAAQAASIARWLNIHCVSAVGRLSLSQIAAVLNRCTVALGNDTGLSHLARACDVKTTIIYGATTWHWGFFPYGPPVFRVIEAPLWCRPCHPHGGNICWRGRRRCLEVIDPSKVVEQVVSLSEAGAN